MPSPNDICECTNLFNGDKKFTETLKALGISWIGFLESEDKDSEPTVLVTMETKLEIDQIDRNRLPFSIVENLSILDNEIQLLGIFAGTNQGRKESNQKKLRKNNASNIRLIGDNKTGKVHILMRLHDTELTSDYDLNRKIYDLLIAYRQAQQKS